MRMTPAESQVYAELLLEDGRLAQLMGHLYWTGGFSSTACLRFLEYEAQKDNVELTDLGSWDYGEWFYTAYIHDDDKGLS